LDYTLTLTNQLISASSNVVVSVFNTTGAGGNTGGEPHLWEVNPAAGSVTIKVRNAGSTAFNGTIKIAFQVIGNP
jgi:hypothetical protein